MNRGSQPKNDQVMAGPPKALYPYLQPAVEADEIGRLGNYRILKVLGQGGMGVVFLAEDLILHRPVALKAMRPEMKADADGWKRFLREARAMASLKHDHLVTIYTPGQEGDVTFFAMELLEGETLESYMRRVPNPPLSEILRIGKEIALGLAFIHQKNLIHRDIKPGNIWLESPNARVKILDLGLARRTDEVTNLTFAGMVLGTPGFMSPEQARGDELDSRTDLFSLGCVLYTLCTGKKPFQGKSSTAVIMALASERPAPIAEINSHMPADLSQLVMQMLKRRPDKRPASATEVAIQLDSLAHERNESFSTQPMGTIQRPFVSGRSKSRSPSSRRFLWIGAGLLSFLGLALLVIYLLVSRPPGPPVPPPPDKKNPGPLAQGEEWTYLANLRETGRELFPNRNFFERKDPKKKGPQGFPPDLLEAMERPVLYQGKEYPKGLFMHAAPGFPAGQESSITYRLDRQYGTLEAEVSLRDGPLQCEPMTFWVYGDGQVLWKSKPVISQDDAQKVKLPMHGIQELKLAVTSEADPKGGHGIWIDPKVSK